MAVIYGYGPNLDDIRSAYNAITAACEDDGATGYPPVVYCDVYLNDIYYKTISHTSSEYTSGTHSWWIFDISGVVQEYMTSVLPYIETPAVLPGTVMDELYRAPPAYNYLNHGGAARCYVKFRSSAADTYGVVTPEGPEPVQATYDSAAVAGAGYMTDRFLAVNAAAQLNTDVQYSLEVHLTAYRRTGTFSTAGYVAQPQQKIYPLTHMRSGKVYANDYAQLPIVIKKGGFYTAPFTYGDMVYMAIAVECYNAAGVRIYAAPYGYFPLYSESIYNVPVGVPNLLVLFPAMSAVLKDTYYYQVFMYTDTWAAINPMACAFVSPKYYLLQAENAQPAEHVRLWFRNYLGHLDQLNFRERIEKGKAVSTTGERRRTTSRQLPTRFRNNVSSNRYAEISDVFTEEEMQVVAELMDSAQVYFDATQETYASPGGARALIPVVIEDMEYETIKYDERYEYKVVLKYSMSHEIITVRG